MNYKPKFLIIVLALLLITSRIVYQHYHLTDKQGTKAATFAIDRQELHDRWQSMPYVTVGGITPAWSKMPAKFNTSITATQHQKLLSDSLELVQMWSSDNLPSNFTQYVAMRYPTDNSPTSAHDGETAATPLQRLTQLLHDDKYNHPFSAISSSNMSVYYSFASKNERPFQQSPKPGIAFPKTFGWNHLDGCFDFKPGFTQHYNQGSKITLATVLFYAQSRRSKIGQPYAMRMWWCEQRKEWLPLDIEWANADPNVYPIIP